MTSFAEQSLACWFQIMYTSAEATRRVLDLEACWHLGVPAGVAQQKNA